MVQDFARWFRREVRILGEDGFEAENIGAPKDDVRGGGSLVLGKDLDQDSGLEGALSAETVCERGIGGGIEVGLSRSGLPRALDLRELFRSDGGRGDIGTFQRLASSGSASSES
jgi:hypothetical protein